VATSAEIRPGSLDERDLAVIEAALARVGGQPAQLVDAGGQPVEVPGELVGVLRAIIQQLRAGNGVSVAPLHAELTTQSRRALDELTRQAEELGLYDDAS
jgi:hypothetical protein